MKRFLALLLALVMGISLISCGKKDEQVNSPLEKEPGTTQGQENASTDESVPETNPAEETETVPEIEFEATPEEHFTFIREGGRMTITGFNQNYQGLVVIPKTLGGYLVASIGEGAFSGCLGITGV
ncbi:MAG: hypothetical protein IKU24_04130, partial [Clostridia bacterium]|nr:hypothetical protein [Clostridia bacterium]